jgi:hypothetical protein
MDVETAQQPEQVNYEQACLKNIHELQRYFRGRAFRRTILSKDYKGEVLWGAELPVDQYIYIKCNEAEQRILKSTAEAAIDTVSNWQPVSQNYSINNYSARCEQVPSANVQAFLMHAWCMLCAVRWQWVLPCGSIFSLSLSALACCTQRPLPAGGCSLLLSNPILHYIFIPMCASPLWAGDILY